MEARNTSRRRNEATAPAVGPLRVLDANPVYFTADGRTPLVLAGAHTWSNLQDFAGEVFCFDSYLDLLAADGLNFIRLWTWPGPINSGMRPLEPSPWCRNPDGKFDLTQSNPEFFARLRDRVRRAGERGIYVSVMLFQWHCEWDLCPFNPARNCNPGTAGLKSLSDCFSLADPEVVALEEGYVRALVEAVDGLDNALWEIGNEIPALGLAWEGHFVGFLKRCESDPRRRHLVGVNTGTSGDPPDASLDQLIATGADFVSLPSPAADSYQPPRACGLPILADTDHINYPLDTTSPAVKVAWAWQSFTRGLHPLDMEALQVPIPGYPPSNYNWNDLSNPAFPAAQEVMATLLRLAPQLPLRTMVPWTCPSPSGAELYALVNRDPEEPFFVVYQSGGDLTLDLQGVSGTLWYETLYPKTGVASQPPQSIQGGDPQQGFPAPFDDAWVLVMSGRNPPIPPLG